MYICIYLKLIDILDQEWGGYSEFMDIEKPQQILSMQLNAYLNKGDLFLIYFYSCLQLFF